MTHVLTKVTLSATAKNLGSLLAEQGATDGGHRLVWTLFPSTVDDRENRDFLYRTVDDRTYLVLSRRPPEDVHRIWDMGPIRPYTPEPRAGEHYRFILRANPTVAISRPARRSDRVDAVMHAKHKARDRDENWSREQEAEAALAWLMNRAPSIGVSVNRDECQSANYRQHRLPRKAAAPIRFSSVDFEGMLEVLDPDRFKASLLTGIGKARAFGCGLMLIRRA